MDRGKPAWFAQHEKSDLREFERLHSRLDQSATRQATIIATQEQLVEQGREVVAQTRLTNSRVNRLEVTTEVDQRVGVAVKELREQEGVEAQERRRESASRRNVVYAGAFTLAGGTVGWLIHLLTGIG